MATSPVTLDKTPPPPSSVTNQMGGGQDRAGLMARIAQALAQRQAAQGSTPAAPPSATPPGAAPAAPANPQGAILAQAEQIEQLISQMARTNQQFAPWGSRLVALLRAGVGEVVNNGTAPGQAQEPPSTSEAAGGSATATGSAKPPIGELAANFSG